MPRGASVRTRLHLNQRSSRPARANGSLTPSRGVPQPRSRAAQVLETHAEPWPPVGGLWPPPRSPPPAAARQHPDTRPHLLGLRRPGRQGRKGWTPGRAASMCPGGSRWWATRTPACGGPRPGGAREPAVAVGTGSPSDELTGKSLWRFCAASVKVGRGRIAFESRPLSSPEGTERPVPLLGRRHDSGTSRTRRETWVGSQVPLERSGGRPSRSVRTGLWPPERAAQGPGVRPAPTLGPDLAPALCSRPRPRTAPRPRASPATPRAASATPLARPALRGLRTCPGPAVPAAVPTTGAARAAVSPGRPPSVSFEPRERPQRGSAGGSWRGRVTELPLGPEGDTPGSLARGTYSAGHEPQGGAGWCPPARTDGAPTPAAPVGPTAAPAPSPAGGCPALPSGCSPNATWELVAPRGRAGRQLPLILIHAEQAAHTATQRPPQAYDRAGLAPRPAACGGRAEAALRAARRRPARPDRGPRGDLSPQEDPAR